METPIRPDEAPDPVAAKPARGWALPPGHERAGMFKARAERVRIPYLGPQPPPSRPFGRVLQITAAGAVLAFLWQATLFVQRAGLFREALRRPSPAIADRIQNNLSLLHIASLIVILMMPAVFVADFTWRRRRRTPGVGDKMGGAYVEYPLNWVVPMPVRLGMAVTFSVAAVLWVAARIQGTLPLADYPAHLELSALSSLAWAVLWIAFAVTVAISDRRHDQRVESSAPDRVNPAAARQFSPIGAIAAGFERLSPPVRRIVRLVGLFTAMAIGIAFFALAIQALAKSAPSGVLWLTIAAVIEGALSRTVIRRFTKHRGRHVAKPAARPNLANRSSSGRTRREGSSGSDSPLS